MKTSMSKLPTIPIYRPNKVLGCFESTNIQTIGDICALLGIRDIDFFLSVKESGELIVYHIDMWFKSERQRRFFMNKVNKQ